jgi:hypothetical protein
VDQCAHQSGNATACPHQHAHCESLLLFLAPSKTGANISHMLGVSVLARPSIASSRLLCVHVSVSIMGSLHCLHLGVGPTAARSCPLHSGWNHAMHVMHSFGSPPHI